MLLEIPTTNADGDHRVETVEATAVPGVDGLFAVNRHWGNAWAVTHIPTGFVVLGYLDHEAAFVGAKELFDRLPDAPDLRSSDPAVVTAAIPDDVREWCLEQREPFDRHLFETNPDLYFATKPRKAKPCPDKPAAPSKSKRKSN